jgi:hypothetical protein
LRLIDCLVRRGFEVIAFRFGIWHLLDSCDYSRSARLNIIRWICESLHTLKAAPLSIPWVTESSLNPLQRLVHDSQLVYVRALQLATHANSRNFCTVWGRGFASQKKLQHHALKHRHPVTEGRPPCATNLEYIRVNSAKLARRVSASLTG